MAVSIALFSREPNWLTHRVLIWVGWHVPWEERRRCGDFNKKEKAKKFSYQVVACPNTAIKHSHLIAFIVVNGMQIKSSFYILILHSSQKRGHLCSIIILFLWRHQSGQIVCSLFSPSVVSAANPPHPMAMVKYGSNTFEVTNTAVVILYLCMVHLYCCCCCCVCVLYYIWVKFVFLCISVLS